MKNLDQRIEELREILQSGAETVIADGVTTKFDLASVRQELRDLERQRRGRRPQCLQVRFADGYSDY